MRNTGWKIVTLLMCLCLAGPVLAGPPAVPSDSDDGPANHKYSAADLTLPSGPRILIEAATGRVLFEDRSGETWYPASITKLMTAYVIFGKLKSGALKLDQQITVSELAHSQEPSKIGVPAGKTVTVDFALQALLVYSANDMAYVLAEAASGTYENFAEEMNAAARGLGMSATHFANPNGLFDPRHVTSARDMAVLAGVLVNAYPEYGHYFQQADLPVGKRRLPNRNSLLRIMPEADGMKTGFVCNSGFNLVASATRGGRRLIAIVFGASSGQVRARIARAMLEQGFQQPAPASARLVSELGNMPQGAIVPKDLTTSVCKTKAPVQLADGTTLGGWGISFGTYDTMLKADMALRGRLLDPVGIKTRFKEGVVQLPEKAGYAAVMWNLPQDQSLSICAAYRNQGAHCDVMPPAFLEQVAALSRKPEPPPAPATVQGSDDAKKVQTGKRIKRTLKTRRKPAR